MTKTADIVIIGGGIIGVSIAYYLGKMGVKDVILFEKDLIGAGSTGLCAGGIRRQWSTEVNMHFAMKSFEVFQNFEEEFGASPEFHQIGYLFLARDEEELESFKKNIELQNRFGVPSQLLTREEVKKEWPFLNLEDVLGGAFCDTDGYAGPNEVTHAIAKGARSQGVKIFEKTEVISIEVARDRIVSVTTKDGNSSKPYSSSALCDRSF